MSICHAITASGKQCRNKCSVTGDASSEKLEPCICKIHQKVSERSQGDVARDAKARRASGKRTAPPTKQGKLSCSSKENVNQPGTMKYCKSKGQTRYWGVKRMNAIKSPVNESSTIASTIGEVGESSTRKKTSANLSSDDLRAAYPGTGPISPTPLHDNRMNNQISIHNQPAHSPDFDIAELSGHDEGTVKQRSFINSLKKAPRLQFHAEKLTFTIDANSSNLPDTGTTR